LRLSRRFQCKSNVHIRAEPPEGEVMPKNIAKWNERLEQLVTMRTIMPTKPLRLEAELMRSKWFNYRFLSPLKATELFRAAYTKALKSYLHRSIDRDLATRAAGVQQCTPEQRQGWFTQLWQARQFADEWPVPYEIFLGFCFEFAGNRKRSWSPLPGQLKFTEKQSEAWRAMWLPYAEDRLQGAVPKLNQLPQYRVEHDRGLHAQVEFRHIMRSQARSSRAFWSETVGTMAIADRVLSLEECLELVPEHMRSETRSQVVSDEKRGRWTPVAREVLDEEDFHLACFGVQESIDASNEPCATCPLLTECLTMAKKVAAETALRTGFESPVDAADKERSRRNTANHRARKAVTVS